MVAIVGITHASQSTTQRDSSHTKRAAKCRWHAIVHILHTLGTIIGTRCSEVYLQVAYRLKHSLDLQILTHIDIGWCRHTISTQQPVAIHSLIDISIAHQTECEVETRSQGTTRLILTKHIAYIGHKSRQQHRILGTITDVDAAHHHEEPGYILRWFVPPFGFDITFHLHRILCSTFGG